jgi:hypothetical protein
MGYFFLSAHPTFKKRLSWTGLIVFARVMLLFITGLDFYPPSADKALALFKIERTGTFLVLMELKTHYFLLGYHSLWHCFIRFGFIVGGVMLHTTFVSS